MTKLEQHQELISLTKRYLEIATDVGVAPTDKNNLIAIFERAKKKSMKVVRKEALDEVIKLDQQAKF